MTANPTLDRPTLEALQQACKAWLEMEGKADWEAFPFIPISDNYANNCQHQQNARNLFRPAIQVVAQLVDQTIDCSHCYGYGMEPAWVTRRCFECTPARNLLTAFLSDPQVAKMVGEAQASEEMESKR